MESSSISINVCKIQETNDSRIEETFKIVNLKLKEVQEIVTTLRTEEIHLAHESAMLKKEEYCLDLKNKILEEEISSLKSQTEKATCSTELLKWKIYKLELTKEFDQKSNESTYKEIYENNEPLNKISNVSMDIDENQMDESEGKVNVTEIKKKVEQLKEEIEKRKQNVQNTDPRFFSNIQILKKRNAALLVRYQRQLGEATARLRQTHAEVSCLKRILAEKNDILKHMTSLSSKDAE